MTAGNLDTECSSRLIQVARDRQCRIASKLRVIVPRHERRITRDQMRLSVLVRPARTGEVGHQSRHAIAADNVRHHDAAPLSSSTNASIRSATSRTLRSVATISACTSPVAFVAFAIWFTLFAIVASSRCVENI